ncbi:MAG: aminopeptidase P N-terminal domain-containing protein, partial [Polaromonas sp.]
MSTSSNTSAAYADYAVYAKRRAAIGRALKAAGGGVALLPTAPEMQRNRDSDFPYRHDSYFYY